MHHDNQHDDLHAYGQRDGYLLSMLRYAMGVTADTPLPTTADQWQQLFDDARRHSLLSVIYQGVSRVAQSATSLPLPLLLRWAGDAESIAQLNREFNAEAARLTQLFEGEGHDTVILKGQANALHYPNPLSRQPGDIDIWVSGGKEGVTAMLRRLSLMDDQSDVGYHHVALQRNAQASRSKFTSCPPQAQISKLSIHSSFSSRPPLALLSSPTFFASCLYCRKHLRE